MTEPAGRSDLLFPREYVIDAGFADRVGTAFFRFSAWRPSRILIPVVAIAVVSVIAGAIGLPWYILTFGGLVGWMVGLFLNWRRLRAQLKKSAPAGGMFAIGFRDDAVVLATPRSTTDNDYRAYEELITYRGFVFLRVRATKSYTLLPGELFTPDSLQWMRDRMYA